MAIVFSVTLFRTQFSAFSNEACYPDTTLQMFFDTASCYISTNDCGRLTGACRLRAINLMTAHLLRISDDIAAGNTSDFVINSTVGSVSVAVQPPPETDQFQWWLTKTPYGQQLYALLGVVSVGGFYVGGSPERSAFRKVGGRF